MDVDIVDYELPDDDHNLYDVTFFDTQIHTLVTHSPSFVDTWISDIENFHSRRLHRLIVGLDVEWRPNNRYIDNPGATLQLCVGKRCLIFQLLYAPAIPQTLIDFLGNPNYTFVGVGIAEDVEKLIGDHDLVVPNAVDLRFLAADAYGLPELRNAGLKGLSRRLLGKEVEKPRRITMSRWDNEWLTADQVQYACLDAFLSFEIGRSLNAADF